MINYESLPSPSAVFADVCKLDKLTYDILVPRSRFYMNQKGKPFETDKK